MTPRCVILMSLVACGAPGNGGAGGGSSNGGGAAMGGGAATGGGSATGGGVATGGGIAAGGGTATGGASATGGGGTDAGLFAHCSLDGGCLADCSAPANDPIATGNADYDLYDGCILAALQKAGLTETWQGQLLKAQAMNESGITPVITTDDSMCGGQNCGFWAISAGAS